MLTGCLTFDAEGGGLSAYGLHLIHGGPRSGRTNFCLGFLEQGLRQGEGGALITNIPVAEVLSRDPARGQLFAACAAQHRLLLFDYPEDLAESLQTRDDDESIADELLQELVGADIDRLVIDSASPMLAERSPSQAVRRMRILVNRLKALNTTAVFVVEAAQGALLKEHCASLFTEILRFDSIDPAAGMSQVTVEQCADVRFRTRRILVGGDASNAHTPASMAARATRPLPLPIPTPRGLLLPAPKARPQILILDPDEARRGTIRSAVESFADCAEARGIVDGYSFLCSIPPDLIVLAEKLPGVSGRDLVKKLRNTGRNMPIIIVGGHLQRSQDRAEMYEAGADGSFCFPLDIRLFRSSIVNWVRRTAPAFAHLTIEPAARIDDDLGNEVTCTYDRDYFFQRIELEWSICQEQETPISICVVRGNGSQTAEELAAICVMVARKRDLVLTRRDGIVVLLSGTASVPAFVRRFNEACRAHPAVRYMAVQEFSDSARESVRTLVDSLEPQSVETNGHAAGNWTEPGHRAAHAAHASMGVLGHAS